MAATAGVVGIAVFGWQPYSLVLLVLLAWIWWGS